MRTSLLEGQYQRLYQGKALSELAADGRPELHLLATSMTTGELVSFNARKMQIERATETNSIDAGRLPVAFAVTASSAFPPLFPPVRVASETFGLPGCMPHAHYLGDGGIFDNLGIQKLLWLNRENNLFDLVVVGDAQREFGKDYNRYAFLLNRATRSSDLLMDRVSYLENEGIKEECARANSELLFCRLQDRVKDTADALTDAEQSAVQNTRTDLDDFTAPEINALVHQGAAVARAAWAAAEKNAVAWEDAHGTAHSIFRQTPSESANGRECWRPIQPKPAPPFDLRSASRRRWGLVRPGDRYSWGFWLLLATFFVFLPVGGWVCQDLRVAAAQEAEGKAKKAAEKAKKAAEDADDKAKQDKEDAKREAADKEQRLNEFRTNHIEKKVRILDTLSRVLMADDSEEWQFSKNQWEKLAAELRVDEEPYFPWLLTDFKPGKQIPGAMASFESRGDLNGITLAMSHEFKRALLRSSMGSREFYRSVLKAKRKEWFDQVKKAASVITEAAREDLSAGAVKFPRIEFWRLYWSEMGMVEGNDVGKAMYEFGKALTAWEEARGKAPKGLLEGKWKELNTALDKEDLLDFPDED